MTEEKQYDDGRQITYRAVWEAFKKHLPADLLLSSAMRPAAANITQLLIDGRIEGKRGDIKNLPEIWPAKALSTVQKAAHRELQHRFSTIAEWRALSAEDYGPAIEFLQTECDRIDQFLAAANDFPAFPQATRLPDSRSSWHKAARTFAFWIEGGFHRAGREPPSRGYSESVLVVVVQELLLLVSITAERDAIRKVL